MNAAGSEMTVEEIKAIKDGDSLIINEVECVFFEGQFFASDMPLKTTDDIQHGLASLSDWHQTYGASKGIHTLTKDLLARDAVRAARCGEYAVKWGMKHYEVVRGGGMTLAKKAKLGAYYERVYGES